MQREPRRCCQAIQSRFGVDPGVIVGIWGLESNFGTGTGGFRVVEALATLAWEGRRASFFRSELMAALRILDHRRRHAGADDRLLCRRDGPAAVHADRPICATRSISRRRPPRHLGQQARRARLDRQLPRPSGWRAGEPWGQPVLPPAGFDPHRDRAATTAARSANGCGWACAGRMAAVQPPGRSRRAACCPTGGGGDAFMVYANFAAIRRYNPSDLLRAGGRPARRPVVGVRRIAVRVLPLALAGCSPAPQAAAAAASPHYVLGAPYQAGGVWYYPRESYDGEETGLAVGLPARRMPPLTADGEVFDPGRARGRASDPAASRRSRALTNLENGRQVLVRINDRGPAHPAGSSR